MISIIIPTKNESKVIHHTLSQFMNISNEFEVIVSDASSDKTAEIARDYATTAPFPIRVVSSSEGRSRQMNEAARMALGDILLFLHADTLLPAEGLTLIEKSSRGPKVQSSRGPKGPRDPRWGGFFLRFEPSEECTLFSSSLLKGIAWRSNVRLRFFKIVYGDQALFVERTLFDEIGGFSDIPILEDLDISKRLRRRAKMVYIRKPVTTSPRRFLNGHPDPRGKRGEGSFRMILRVYLKMFCVLFLYKLGVKLDYIKKFYDGADSICEIS